MACRICMNQEFACRKVHSGQEVLEQPEPEPEPTVLLEPEMQQQEQVEDAGEEVPVEYQQPLVITENGESKNQLIRLIRLEQL